RAQEGQAGRRSGAKDRGRVTFQRTPWRMASVPPTRPDRIDPQEPPGVEPVPVEPQPDVSPETAPPVPDIDQPDRAPEEYPAPGQKDAAASRRARKRLTLQWAIREKPLIREEI